MAEWLKTEGITDYEPSLLLMERIVEEVISGQKKDTIILTEHPDVITAGTSAQTKDLLSSTDIPIIHTGRGGKYTFHGPGQRVIYPIIDLKNKPWNKDLKKYLNFLHNWIIASLSHFGIKAHSRSDHIGIWVVKNGVDAKIAAIGIRARKWVAYHGIAINITTDLSNFKSFIPCGINDLGITSVVEMVGSISLEKFDEILIKEYYVQIKLLESSL